MELYVEMVAASCNSAKESEYGEDLWTNDRTKTSQDRQLITKNKPGGIVRLIVEPVLWEELERAISHLVRQWSGSERTLSDGKIQVEFYPV